MSKVHTYTTQLLIGNQKSLQEIWDTTSNKIILIEARRPRLVTDIYRIMLARIKQLQESVLSTSTFLMSSALTNLFTDGIIWDFQSQIMPYVLILSHHTVSKPIFIMTYFLLITFCNKCLQNTIYCLSLYYLFISLQYISWWHMVYIYI